jgi:ankyrin repeat protein
MVAAQAGHLDVVQSLLSAGVSINRTMWDGATPLFLAAQVGRLYGCFTLCKENTAKKPKLTFLMLKMAPDTTCTSR